MFPSARKIRRLALATALLLSVPLIAMRFTAEVNWGLGDFIAAGLLLFGTGFLYELIAARHGHAWHKLAVALAAGTALLLVWINLAVGIIGSEGNPANLLFAGVLAVAAVGTALSRFEPAGLARAMAATALAQALVALITGLAGLATGPELTKSLGVGAGFVALWTAAALLFRRAAAARTA